MANLLTKIEQRYQNNNLAETIVLKKFCEAKHENEIGIMDSF